MAYKNSKGENLYMFGWLQAEPGSKEFHQLRVVIQNGQRPNVRQSLRLIVDVKNMKRKILPMFNFV
jgi:hypothetical protein